MNNEVYDSIITLSHCITRYGSLCNESKLRMDESIELYRRGIAKTIIMSGGQTNTDSPYTGAGCMEEYALARRICPSALFREESSLDTVGQAIYTKQLVVPKRWSKLIVISSTYHLNRAKTIFDFVFGENFNINYIGVDVATDDAAQLDVNETESLEAFLSTFKGIKSAQDWDILSRLWDSNPLYRVVGRN